MLFEKCGGDFHRLGAPGIAHPKRMRGVFECVNGRFDAERLQLLHHLSTTDFERVFFAFDEDRGRNSGANVSDG